MQILFPSWNPDWDSTFKNAVGLVLMTPVVYMKKVQLSFWGNFISALLSKTKLQSFSEIT